MQKVVCQRVPVTRHALAEAVIRGKSIDESVSGRVESYGNQLVINVINGGSLSLYQRV